MVRGRRRDNSTEIKLAKYRVECEKIPSSEFLKPEERDISASGIYHVEEYLTLKNISHRNFIEDGLDLIAFHPGSIFLTRARSHTQSHDGFRSRSCTYVQQDMRLARLNHTSDKL